MIARIILVFLCLLQGMALQANELLDVIWNSPSRSSSESMPVGGGDIGMNVWVENGDLLFYIGRSNTFDENNTLLKQGRIRLTLSPNPFKDAADFRQHMAMWKWNRRVAW